MRLLMLQAQYRAIKELQERLEGFGRGCKLRMAEFEVKGEEKYCESEMEEKGLRFSFIELLCNSPTQFTFGCECFPQISFFVSIILYLNFLFTPSFPL